MSESVHFPDLTGNALKKVLIITYYWPPSGGAGVQRWLKYSKYLPEYGWQPVILTVDPRYASYPQQDRDLINDIPENLEVIYTKAPTRISWIYKKITGKAEIPYGGFANESDPGLIQKIFRFVRGNFFLPDSRIGWNRYALKCGIEIIKTKHIDTVITTSPPHSTQLTGLNLKKKLNIKWIADLRDPWTDIYYTGQMYQTSLARKKNISLEARVLESADRIITTCNSTRDLFRSKLAKEHSPEKIVTVTNGYDEEDFRGEEKIVPDRFLLTYLGTFSQNYNIDVLLKALESHAERTKNKVPIRFIGKIDDKMVDSLKKIHFLSLEIIPYVEHKKALGYLAGSSALLLVIPSRTKSEEMIPGKLFEYLASGRPIIAIGPKESDVGEILNTTKSGRIFENEDYIDLLDYIDEIFNNNNKGVFETNPVSIERYSRRNLSGEIASVIESVS
jgi:glycosyltransferase involved in cell wall biosynthesis